MLGSRLYFQFSEENEWEQKMSGLINELKTMGVYPLTTSPSPSISSPSIPPPVSPPSIPPPPISPPVISPSPQAPPALPSTRSVLMLWKENEVNAWLTRCDLQKLIPIFQQHDFSGGSLKELHDILIHHRSEYFAFMKEMGVSIGLTLQLSAHLKLLHQLDQFAFGVDLA